MHYKIGLISEARNRYYTEELANGVTDAIINNDGCLIKMPQMSPASDDESVLNYFRFIVQSINQFKLDAYIIPIGTMIVFHPHLRKDIVHLFEKTDHSKILMIEEDIEGFPSLPKDNQTGLREVMVHLLDHHHYTKIALLSGPKTSTSSKVREAVYFEEMEKRNLPTYMRHGLYSGYCHETVNEILDDNPGLEAIVCCNDYEAKACYDVCQERGLKVGKDIAITGFDNTSFAALLEPPLTTVKLDPYAFGYEAGIKALEIADGTYSESEPFPSEMVVRASCGCNDESTLVELKEEYDKTGIFPVDAITEYLYYQASPYVAIDEEIYLVKELVEISRKIVYKETFDPRKGIQLFASLLDLAEDSHFSVQLFYDALNKYYRALSNEAGSLRAAQEISDYNQYFGRRYYLEKDAVKVNMNYSTRSIMQIVRAASEFTDDEDSVYHEIYKYIKENFEGNFYQYNFFETLDVKNDRSDHNAYFKASIEDDDINIFNKTSAIDAHSIIEHICSKDDRHFAFAGLSTNSNYSGFIICSIKTFDSTKLYPITLELSLAMQYLEIFKHEHEMIKALNDRNISLKKESHHDPMTGLLNRRGLEIKSEEAIATRDSIILGTLYCIDMDGLKTVNDTYGHDEGDFAIKTIAKIIKQSFRKSDIISRIGGDEFIVISLGGQNATAIKKRIDKACASFNKSSNKPYDISVSVGDAQFMLDSEFKFNEVFKKADEKLYNIKKTKKAARRGS